LHADAVEDKADGSGKECCTRVDRGGEANPLERPGGLIGGGGGVAIETGQEVGGGSAECDADPQSKNDSGGHCTCGAAACLPLSKVGNVAHHGPKHRTGAAKAELSQN